MNSNEGGISAELVERLATAHAITALTGAGVSAESGVPTFRDAQTGLWSKYRPEELATVEAFAGDPDNVWAWYEWRRNLVARARPNPGHVALAQLEDLVASLTIVTQNVDGLHRRAGSSDVVEFHGNLFDNRCLDCGADAREVPRPCPRPPRCEQCGGFIRPGVVWFGEAIPVDALEKALHATDSCGVLISIGTSSLVYPAAGLAERARSHGACIVEINPQPTGISEMSDFSLRGPSGTILPAIVQLLRSRSATRP